MKTANDFFRGNIFDVLMFESLHSGFNVESFYTPGPKGDDDDESENDTQEENDSNGSGSDDPPMDTDVVHSPLTTQPGGKPKD